MSFIDDNVIFCLRGDEFRDSSSNAVAVVINTMNGNQIVDSENEGKKIKAINFNNSGYLTFTLNGSFLQNEYTIDWWEYDAGNITNTTTTSLFNNINTASGNFNFGFVSNHKLRNALNVGSKSGTASYDIFGDFVYGDDIAKQWVHRAVIFNGSSYKFYQNGKLYAESITSKVPQRYDNFQMNRWRATSSANGLGKMIYNFRISNIVRWASEFVPDATQYVPSDNNHECPTLPPTNGEIIKADIEDVVIEEINDTTLSSVLDKVIDIKVANEKLKNNLVKVLNVKGINATVDEKMNDLIKKVNNNL